jgi:hypothetical protein
MVSQYEVISKIAHELNKYYCESILNNTSIHDSWSNFCEQLIKNQKT